MPLEILDAVTIAGLAPVDDAERGRGRLPRTLEMGIDIVDLDQDAVDHPGDFVPARGGFTVFAVMFGASGSSAWVSQA